MKKPLPDYHLAVSRHTSDGWAMRQQIAHVSRAKGELRGSILVKEGVNLFVGWAGEVFYVDNWT